MSRTEKFALNSLTSAILQIVVMISTFIIPRIILRSYGSEINGLVTSITQFIGYFNLVEAGIASAAIYSLYKPLSENNNRVINIIVSTAKRFYNISGYIFVALVLGLSLIYPLFVSGSLNVIETGVLVLVIGASGALEFFTMSKYRVLLTADQKSYVISLSSIVAHILNTLIIYILASNKVDIVIVRLIALISVFARSIILSFYVKKKYSNINYNSKIDNNYISKRWDAMYLQLLGAVQTGVPILLATFMLNLKMVSVYSIFNLIINGINSILGIFVTGLAAGFGEIIAKKEINVLKAVVNEFEYIYYDLLSICYGLCFVLIMPFIKLYTSGIVDINYNLPLLGALMVINGFLYNMKTPQGMLVISAGLFKETRTQSIIQALIIIVSGLPLTYFFGIYGIVISSILSNIYRVIDLMFYIPRNVTKRRVIDTLMRYLKIIVSTTLIILPHYFIDINLTSFAGWIGYAIISLVYSLIIVLSIDLIVDRKVLFSVVERFKHIIKVRL